MRPHLIMTAILVLTAGVAHAQTPIASVCPDNFDAYAGTADPVPCVCPAEATGRGSVWGTDVYTGDSSVCRAAVHAGIIGARGGAVTVLPEAGRSAYPGVTRNGVSSSNYGAYRSSFRFAQASQAPTASQAPPSQATASVCPDNFDVYAGTTDPLSCICPAEATRRGSVWGTDVYTGDSSVCRAAVHAGAIGTRGGDVTVLPEAGRNAYPGVTRNGVSSSNYGSYRSSFRFAQASQSPTAGTASPTPPPAQATASVCPDNFDAYAGTTDPLPCICPAEATRRGSVWGTDVYTGDSSVCRAAVHAGAIGTRGGDVTVLPEAGRNAYPGVTRNGVSSSNYGSYRSSFRFAQAPQAPAAPPAAPTLPPAQTTTSVCPDNFDVFAGTTDPLPCICPAEATGRGSVWGTDIYTGDSSVCRAAMHAGVIGPRGGAVTVLPEAGRNAYPGVTRNGVSSSNYGPYASSFRFAAALRPAASTDRPVQAPIAATLQARGEVALYIQFRFNSSDLDMDAAPTLMELRDALTATPGLRLMLIGHTDAIGTPQYNRSLSLRRAQSVMNWLTIQGVAPGRLAVDGKGQEQPIADNSTDAGRAVNRRVQAVRIP